MLNKLTLKFRGEEEAEWHDMKTGKVLKGKVYAYLFSHKGIEWLINVRITKDKDHAIVELISSSKAGIIPRQLTQKSIILQKSKVKGYLYVPVSIAYLDKVKRRVHYSRVSKKDTLPENMEKLFRVVIYEDAAPPKLIHPRNPYRGKITVLVEHDNHEKMALLYIYTRILPLEKWLM